MRALPWGWAWMGQPAMIYAGNLMGVRTRRTLLLQRVQRVKQVPRAHADAEVQPVVGPMFLGRPECGRIALSKRADIAIWDISGVESAGSWDPAALVLAGPNRSLPIITINQIVSPNYRRSHWICPA